MIRIKQLDSFHLCIIYPSIHCFERGIYPENLHTFYVVLLKNKKSILLNLLCLDLVLECWQSALKIFINKLHLGSLLCSHDREGLAHYNYDEEVKKRKRVLHSEVVIIVSVTIFSHPLFS